jgi:hypothetical protein
LYQYLDTLQQTRETAPEPLAHTRCNRHMRRLAPILAVLAVLVAAPAAQAKEITKVTACGVDGCVTTRDPAILQGLMNGGPPTVPPEARGDVIRLTATVAERPGGKAVGRFETQWVPSLRLLVAEDGTWMSMPADAERALNGLGLKPFPAPRAATPATPPPPSDDGAVPSWVLIAAALALAAALVAAAMLAQRPRPSATA